jgi:hypothetical protein
MAKAAAGASNGRQISQSHQEEDLQKREERVVQVGVVYVRRRSTTPWLPSPTSKGTGFLVERETLGFRSGKARHSPPAGGLAGGQRRQVSRYAHGRGGKGPGSGEVGHQALAPGSGAAYQDVTPIPHNAAGRQRNSEV